MENGHPEETQRSKSTKKKKRKRERENELEHPIDTQETLQNGSFQVNSEEASTDIVEKDLAEEEAPKSKSSKKKKKKRKREHENDVEIAPDSQESQQTDGTQVYSLDAPTADTESKPNENGPAGEGSPKKKRKREQKEDKVTDQPNSDEKPPNKGTKSKAKKPRTVKGGFGLACPHQILDIEKEFLSTHKDERFAEKVAGYLTPENRALMRKNWNEFFQNHPHPQPTVLLRQKDNHDENTLKEVESFIRENDFYKHLVQGIDDHPRRIIRTAIRFYPYRKAIKKQNMEEVFSANPSVPPLRENEPPTLQEVLRLSGDSSLWELLRRTYTDLECTWIYHATLKQVKCKLWHKHRVGRITASRMHRIYNFMTSGKTVLTPSITKDTMRHMSPRQCGNTWGERMESVAIGDYVKRMSLLHDDLRVLPCGLWVNPELPHLGASSDGYVTCSCCPPRLLEVKCPESLQMSTPEKATFVEKSHMGGFTLQQPHKYHTQALAQMALMDTPRLDFLVWTPKDLIIIPLALDTKMWHRIKEACNGFFERHIVDLLRKDMNCRSKQKKAKRRIKLRRRR